MSKSVRALASSLVIGAIAVSGVANAATLKFGHDNKPDPTDNPAHACAQVFSSIVETDTNGEIEVEFYPNNELGSGSEHIQMVRDGVIQATIVSTGAMSSYYPRIDVLNLPFAFANNAATYQVFDGPFGKALKRDIEDTLGDVVVLGFPDTGGFFAVTNSQHEIATVEDFNGVRIRTMKLPSHKVIMNALGAEAYPLAWGEVYSALQTGVIDGQMNPIPIISFSNFQEVQKYLTLTRHLFSPYTLLLSKDFWDGLDARQQNILRYAANSCVTASRGMARIIEASDRGLKGVRQEMQVTALSPDQRDQMRDATRPAFIDYIESNYGDKAVDMLGLLKQEVKKANEAEYMEADQ
ncbi:TRAP transporter substrate-binding protein [Rhodovibrio salinarum]|uniref:C4-dicarboxylate ABC transporter substrate-binding protein n=1 Tax=Rhodovibrio salinarum TaxID=1087 RepID=A0A934QGZ0_9PROT|nr:DctP family TRAP transporter solute-binding subunit [Rhodovibrio salinarum]MBK1696594.1 C4-dicarboxylate ABC transporter substrate-binding protein [Rhodovibrio salinarum]